MIIERRKLSNINEKKNYCVSIYSGQVYLFVIKNKKYYCDALCQGKKIFLFLCFIYTQAPRSAMNGWFVELVCEKVISLTQPITIKKKEKN